MKLSVMKILVRVYAIMFQEILFFLDVSQIRQSPIIDNNSSVELELEELEKKSKCPM